MLEFNPIYSTHSKEFFEKKSISFSMVGNVHFSLEVSQKRKNKSREKKPTTELQKQKQNAKGIKFWSSLSSSM